MQIVDIIGNRFIILKLSYVFFKNFSTCFYSKHQDINMHLTETWPIHEIVFQYSSHLCVCWIANFYAPSHILMLWNILVLARYCNKALGSALFSRSDLFWENVSVSCVRSYDLKWKIYFVAAKFNISSTTTLHKSDMEMIFTIIEP